MKLTEKEIEEILAHGLSEEKVRAQIRHFETGFPFINLQAAAVAGNGILRLEAEETERLIEYYEHVSADLKIIKFVPASGAATRMFSHLHQFTEEARQHPETAVQLLEEEKHKAVKEFFTKLERFPFYRDLDEVLKKSGEDLRSCLKNQNYVRIIEGLLLREGLGYAFLPKALIQFHEYESAVRRAVEEHLVEGALYCSNERQEVHLHFTLSPEHIELFEALMKETVPSYEKRFGIRYSITHSVQDAGTDIIAVDPDNHLFHDANGHLVFRPAGHGALICNLNQLEADLIFIKNIDNLVPDRLKGETVRYKKVIGGMLLELQERIFGCLAALNDANLTEEELSEIEDFCRMELLLRFPEDFDAMEKMEKIDLLYGYLNRPMRVCGMVVNEGEPGGGPFWVLDDDGIARLQIVESSQVDSSNAVQLGIFKSSTHFNPVDLACSTRDYRGDKFNLEDYTNPATGFISVKSKDGKPLKAQELPGLWNGAMADWLTLFVEVPAITFNPVKTVNDLLRPNHQRP